MRLSAPRLRRNIPFSRATLTMRHHPIVATSIPRRFRRTPLVTTHKKLAFLKKILYDTDYGSDSFTTLI